MQLLKDIIDLQIVFMITYFVLFYIDYQSDEINIRYLYLFLAELIIFIFVMFLIVIFAM